MSEAIGVQDLAAKRTRDSERPEPAASILRLLYNYRREATLPEGAGEARDEFIERHRPSVEWFVRQNLPVHFVLPAFPAKSPNPNKVLGHLPDLAEHVALAFLQSLCDQVAHYYAPGGKITICSDGRVFSDAVAVVDQHVTEYRNGMHDVLMRLQASCIDVYGLDDAFPGRSHDAMRTELYAEYAQPVDKIRQQVKTDRAMNTMFSGIHRFMLEDLLYARPGKSRTSVREEAKPLAYEVIRRSSAWSDLVAQQFPKAVRLSIHPQLPGSVKIGLHLCPTKDVWLTPWHGVALDTGKRFELMHRDEAERRGATLVHRDGRPSHFVAPEV